MNFNLGDTWATLTQLTFQVVPAELEGILVEHPDVLDAGVIGIHDVSNGVELPRSARRSSLVILLTERLIAHMLSLLKGSLRSRRNRSSLKLCKNGLRIESECHSSSEEVSDSKDYDCLFQFMTRLLGVIVIDSIPRRWV